MFSATFPTEIQELAGSFLDNYLFLAVGIVGGACADVHQIFYQVPKAEKRNKLKELLMQDGVCTYCCLFCPYGVENIIVMMYHDNVFDIEYIHNV